jgi:hypothetical protein
MIFLRHFVSFQAIFVWLKNSETKASHQFSDKKKQKGCQKILKALDLLFGCNLSHFKLFLGPKNSKTKASHQFSNKQKNRRIARKS